MSPETSHLHQTQLRTAVHDAGWGPTSLGLPEIERCESSRCYLAPVALELAVRIEVSRDEQLLEEVDDVQRFQRVQRPVERAGTKRRKHRWE